MISCQVLQQMSDQFHHQLDRCLKQARALGHEFVAYTLPKVSQTDARSVMSFHIKSFQHSSALSQFIDAQKETYFVIELF